MLLFVIAMVMVTAAVQTHRHPERYSPQQGRAGRPKQSRAKGLARAVLESIPIVKFIESNDKEADAAAHKDIELADTGQANCDQSTTTDANDPATSRHASIVTSSRGTTIPVTAASGLSTTEPDIQARSDGLGCSICVEDFVKGEDIRVLPCNHKFHPACIDPWLLNISGTCPLCRINLSPTNTSDAAAANLADGPLPPPLPDETSDTAPYRSHRSSFDDLRRAARSRPEECIAALRRLYHENRRASHASTETVASRGTRLTSRLRDTFGIQTRPPNS